MSRSLLTFCVSSLLLVTSATALAQSAAAPGEAAASDPDAANKEQAKEHFLKGVSLFKEEAWAAALAEFLKSRELYKGRAATKNAAICLRKLHRFDESLAMFEALLAEFSDLDADDTSVAESAIRELRGLVASVELREAEPGSAISVDGRDFGLFPTEKPIRISAGSHVIRLYKEGFAPFETQVDLAGGQTQVIVARLVSLTAAVVEAPKTAPEAPKTEPAKEPSGRIAIEVHGALAISPSYGSDLEANCSDPCSKATGFGALALLHAGYELPSGIGFGLAAGYLVNGKQLETRPTVLRPVGKPNNPGAADDQLRLGGVMVGATGSYHLGEQMPLLFRLGAGVLIGSMTDVRTGRFVSSAGGAYQADSVTTKAAMKSFYLDPEVRFGLRFADHFEVTLGVEAAFLIGLSSPEWDVEQRVVTPDDGLASYAGESLSSGVVIVIAPGLGFRADF